MYDFEQADTSNREPRLQAPFEFETTTSTKRPSKYTHVLTTKYKLLFAKSRQIYIWVTKSN